MQKIKISNSEIYYSITRHGEVPTKYSYIGEGARYWEKLTSSWAESGLNTDAELDLLEKNSASISDTVHTLGSFKPNDVHVIDLGCGDGKPAAVLCRRMPTVGYTAVDISPEMIEIALRTIGSHLPKQIETTSFVLDFETQSPKQIVDELCDARHTNLFMFIGNTLGNYTNAHQIISGIVSAMNNQDYLLVGNGLVPTSPLSAKRLVDTYDKDEERNLLSSTTRKLGIPVRDIRFIWSGDNEVQAIGKIDRDVVLKHYFQTCALPAGTELLLLRSRKYSPQNLTNLLTSAGMTIVGKWVNPGKTNMLALCKPTFRYNR